MTALPNGCRCSNLSVYPADWKTVRADINCIWYIHYRFYEEGKEPKQVSIRGMNDFYDLRTRQITTENLISNELKQLQSGYKQKKIKSRKNRKRREDEELKSVITPFAK